MTEVIENPTNIPEGVTTGYQAQNTVLYASMVGFTNINFRNNKIAAGSIFEYLGNLIKVIEDEDVYDINSMNNSLFYIYAYFNASNIVLFRASTDEPIWNEHKNGYYKSVDGNLQRAIIKAVRNISDNSITGVQMNNILNNVTSVTPPNSGGNQVYTKNVRAHEVTHQNPGWYRFEIKSGSGKGNGVNSSNQSGGGGGVPSIFNSINGVFYHLGGAILVHIGGNGFNGGSGESVVYSYGSSGAGAGGGSGAGEESYIMSGSQIYKTEKIFPGNGGSSGNKSGGGGFLDNIASNINFSLSYSNGSNGSGNKGGKGGGQGGNGGAGTFNNTQGENGFIGILGYGGGGAGGQGYHGGENSEYGGGGGGGGGAPGWNRSLGDTAAGYVTLWFLGQ